MYHWTPDGYMEELKCTYPLHIVRDGRRWILCGISYTAGQPSGLYRDKQNNYRAFSTRRKETK